LPEEESSEDEGMNKYIHPGELEKLRKRKIREKEKEKQRKEELQHKPVVHHPLENNIEVKSKTSSDQEGWEDDEININSPKLI